MDGYKDIENEIVSIVKTLKSHIMASQDKPRGLSRFSMKQRRLSEKSLDACTPEESIPCDEKEDRNRHGIETLEDVRSALGECRRCQLCEARKNIVFGEGNPKAEIVFVGEAPGEDEDIQGRPFVGRAGQLLTRIIEAMGLKREDVYICNILKCRPPKNRNPQQEEIESCEPFVIRQIEVIRPKVICTLGTFAARTLLKKEIPVSLLRGQFHSFRGIQLMPTYHPAYLLRNPSAKKQVWEDVQKIMKMTGTSGNG
jgi:uracil-DNA glycosylase